MRLFQFSKLGFGGNVLKILLTLAIFALPLDVVQCTYIYLNSTHFTLVLSFPVMEVASGEYGVDLVKTAQTMTQFKPELVGNGSWESHIPTLPALLPSAIGT